MVRGKSSAKRSNLKMSHAVSAPKGSVASVAFRSGKRARKKQVFMRGEPFVCGGAPFPHFEWDWDVETECGEEKVSLPSGCIGGGKAESADRIVRQEGVEEGRNEPREAEEDEVWSNLPHQNNQPQPNNQQQSAAQKEQDGAIGKSEAIGREDQRRGQMNSVPFRSLAHVRCVFGPVIDLSSWGHLPSKRLTARPLHYRTSALDKSILDSLPDYDEDY